MKKEKDRTVLKEDLPILIEALKKMVWEKTKDKNEKGVISPFSMCFLYSDTDYCGIMAYRLDETDNTMAGRRIVTGIYREGSDRLLQHFYFVGTHEECMAWLQDKGNEEELFEEYMGLLESAEEKEL